MSELAHPRRIVHVITRMGTGGSELNTLYSVNGLAELGWEVYLVVGRDLDLRVKVENKVHPIIQISDLVRDPSPQDLPALHELYQVFKKLRPALVHTHQTKAGVLGRLAARWARVPAIVHTIHGGPLDSVPRGLKRWLAWAAEKAAASCTTFYVSVGEEILTKVAGQGLADTARSQVIRSGIDLSHWTVAQTEVRAFRASRLGNGATYLVGAVGRLSPQKGYEDLIQVARVVASIRRDIKIVVVGPEDDADYATAIKAKAQDLVAAGVMEFWGALPPTKIPLVLASLDAFVHTSRWEGVPRTVVEALLLNRPVVLFETEGVREVVVDGVNGYVIPGRNHTIMAERLVDVVEKGSVSEDQEKVNASVRARYDKRVMINELDALYRRLLAFD